jgi:excisionase family DNA binding protein
MAAASQQRMEIAMSSSSASGQAALLTVEEAAERLRIGRTSMYRLVSTGAIETVTVGRLRRVPLECLAEYVATLRRARGSEAANDTTAA